MANCWHGDKIIGNLPRYHIKEVRNRKIGFFGLSEPDWLGTLNPNTVPEELTFTDFCETAVEMIDLLKGEGCDFIIALTHMRLPNDRILAQNCPQIDLILGGHDHSSVCEVVNSVTIVKSGSDFEEFSDIKVDFKTKEITRERVLISDQFEPD
jgi:5'-nucleotidase